MPVVSCLAELIRLLSTPLAILNRRALLSESPGDCALRIHPSLPIQDVTLLADPTDYAHKSASLNLGSLGISIGMGSPFRFQVDDHAVVSLLLSCGGQGQLAMGGQRFAIDPERPALYLPGEAFTYQIHQPHGLVITTQVEHLAAQALLLAEQAGVDGLDLSVLQRPLAIGPTRVALRQLLGLIPKTLALLDLSDATKHLAPGPPPRAGSAGGLGQGQEEAIASLICRQIAGLVYPQLLEGARR